MQPPPVLSSRLPNFTSSTHSPGSCFTHSLLNIRAKYWKHQSHLCKPADKRALSYQLIIPEFLLSILINKDLPFCLQAVLLPSRMSTCLLAGTSERISQHLGPLPSLVVAKSRHLSIMRWLTHPTAELLQLNTRGGLEGTWPRVPWLGPVKHHWETTPDFTPSSELGFHRG